MRDGSMVAADGSPVDEEETVEAGIMAPEVSGDPLDLLRAFVNTPASVDEEQCKILVSFGYVACRVGGGFVLTVDGKDRLGMVWPPIQVN